MLPHQTAVYYCKILRFTSLQAGNNACTVENPPHITHPTPSHNSHNNLASEWLSQAVEQLPLTLHTQYFFLTDSPVPDVKAEALQVQAACTAMPSSSSIIWGLVNNVQYEGGIVDNTSTMALNTGWNPSLGLKKQSFPCSASSGCTDLQQLEMGWRYTVVVAGGQAYVCETKDLQCISSGSCSTGEDAR